MRVERLGFCGIEVLPWTEDGVARRFGVTGSFAGGRTLSLLSVKPSKRAGLGGGAESAGLASVDVENTLPGWPGIGRGPVGGGEAVR